MEYLFSKKFADVHSNGDLIMLIHDIGLFGPESSIYMYVPDAT